MARRKGSILHKLDILLLFLFPLLATVISLTIKADYFTSTFLFFVIPSIYYAFRTPKAFKQVAIFTLIMFVPLGVISDYIFEAANAWLIPHSIFNSRVFGVIPIENFLWGMGACFLCLILYEHYLDKSKHKINARKTKIISSVIFFIFITFCLIFFYSRHLLIISYPYFWIGVVMLAIPTVTFLFSFPKLVWKFCKICAYFFCVAGLNEFTALTLDHWRFTSPTYIGWMPFFGYSIPLEEFLFYFVILSLALLSYFEFFFDDRK